MHVCWTDVIVELKCCWHRINLDLELFYN